MGTDEIIVTCARTRGSTMNVLPVAAATASVICVISASLKFGVMRPDCWAGAIDTVASSTTAAQTNRKHFTGDSPEAGYPALLRCIRKNHQQRRLRLIRRYPLSHSFGFLCVLCFVL